MRTVFLMCGIAAALAYVGTDIAASLAYSGYSYADQAVSELFAIGAPTSRLVVSLFTLSSLLLGMFAIGIWKSAGRSRRLRYMAACFAGSALVGLVLWNFFPMHMRGVQRTFTDKMHLILATNPFVLLSIALGAAVFPGWFRWYTWTTILLLVLPAAFAFMYASAIEANLPTPGLGLGERTAQYAYAVWQLVLALVLLRKQRPMRNGR